MKLESTDDLYQELRTSYTAQVTPRITLDWNMNRYIKTVTPSNGTIDALRVFDADRFPISSIVNGYRPAHKGLPRAIIGQSVIAEPYLTTSSPRFYVAGYDDEYKYWISPDKTNNIGVFPLDGGVTTTRPQVIYGVPVRTNKIVIKTENTWSSMGIYKVYTTTNGTTWTQIFSNGSVNTQDEIDTTGNLILWRSASGWSDVEPANYNQTLQDTPILGIKLEVSALTYGSGLDGFSTSYIKFNSNNVGQVMSTDGSNSNFQLIAIEPHYVLDVTDRLISFDTSFDMSSPSETLPIGSLLSNDGNAVLYNDDLLFSAENTGWMAQANMINPNVDVTIDLDYLVDGFTYSIRHATMVVQNWSEDAENITVSAKLSDHSEYLKATKPQASLYTDVYLSQAIWQVLDSVGFNNYQIDTQDIYGGLSKIPFFYLDGEKSAWEMLDSIAQATQTAIYFDNEGVLQIKTTGEVFSNTTPIWTLRGEDSGNELADIITITSDGEYASNKITVNYSEAAWNVGSNGKPAADRLWSPEGDIVARSQPLIGFGTSGLDSDTSHQYIMVDPSKAAMWPWSGKAYVGSEVIEWEGKRYMALGGRRDGGPTISIVKNQEEQDAIDAVTNVPWQNVFSGALLIKTRGVWNTPVQTGMPELDNFTVFGPTPSVTSSSYEVNGYAGG